jgi:aspartate/methionine/tyrosine aminotransferase
VHHEFHKDAALFGLANLSNWVSEKQKIIKDRCDFVQGLFQSKDINFELVSCGAYFAYIKHPFVELSARQVAKKLAKQANILCLPGTFFGPNQEQFLRIAFANASIEEMTLVEERLRQYYD